MSLHTTNQKQVSYPSLIVIIISGFLLFAASAALAYKTGSTILYRNLNQYYAHAIHHELQDRRPDMQRFYHNGCHDEADAYIAHSGGIAPYTYTNCREAVLASLAQGFRFIEIDLQETADGHLIGAHSWQDLLTRTHAPGNPGSPLPLQYAKALKIDGQYSVLDGADIAAIMREYPDMILVTDKIEKFPLLLKEIPFPERMIVETFSEQSYLRALRSGIRYPALCISGHEEGLRRAQELGIPIVTMGTYGLALTPDQIEAIRQLHQQGTTILLFGTGDRNFDSPEFVREHLGRTVSKIYTDRWTPQHMPR